MHYELFIPGQFNAAEDALQSVGFDGYGNGVESSIVEFGPTGERGYWLAWRGSGRRPQFNDHAGRWMPAEAFDGRPPTRYHIAIDLEDPPKPQDLAKARMVEGRRVTLRDGNSWLMPSVPKLERSIVLRDGEFAMAVDPVLAWAYAEAQRWHELAEQPNTRHEVIDAMRTVYRILCINYRLTPELVNVLGLFTSKNVEECLMAMIGIGGGND